MNKLTDFQRRKRLRERVAAWRAKKKAERLAAEVAAAQPVSPAAELVPVSVSPVSAGPMPELAREPAAPRVRYWTINIAPEGCTPILQRVRQTPDLAELQRVYHELFGEPLPVIFETRWVDDESAEALRGYLAMPIEARARMHYDTWSTRETRHAEFERRFNPPRSTPPAAPVHSEPARIEALIHTLAGPLEPPPVPKAGLDALSGKPEN